MPCSLRSTRCVTRAVSVGRSTALPTEASVAATTRPGSVDTPQLHFEIRKGSRAVEPTAEMTSQSAAK